MRTRWRGWLYYKFRPHILLLAFLLMMIAAFLLLLSFAVLEAAREFISNNTASSEVGK